MLDFPEGFEPPDDAEGLSPTLYATIPTVESFRQILTLWRAHQNGEAAPHGSAPWWNLFDQLLELRPWGPADRFPDSVRAVVLGRLPLDDQELANLEIEIVPTMDLQKRGLWREEIERSIAEYGGEVIHRSSINEPGFVYEAVLARLPASAIRAIAETPADVQGLATLEGIQFILPQTIGQAIPAATDQEPDEFLDDLEANSDGPIRAALFDGTPAAAHPALLDGVVIEDVHDLVRLSQVNQRYHATSMASLILRGDLQADALPLGDSRVVSDLTPVIGPRFH